MAEKTEKEAKAKPEEKPKEPKAEPIKEKPKAEEPAEKAEEKPKEEPAEEKVKEKAPRDRSVKKWRGKEWFTIQGPKMFRNAFLGETPTTDPKSLVGRVIEVGVPDVTNDPTKYYMRLRFRAESVENGTVQTRFDGYSCIKEHIYRVVRKRAQKVTSIDEMETKDKWKLQITTTLVLNRNVNTTVKKETRKFIRNFLNDSAKKLGMDDFIKAVISGVLQKKMRKGGSKIYPVRFSEIEKIEVLKHPK